MKRPALLYHSYIISLNCRHQKSKLMTGIKQKYKLLLPIWWWSYDAAFSSLSLSRPAFDFFTSSHTPATPWKNSMDPRHFWPLNLSKQQKAKTKPRSLTHVGKVLAGNHVSASPGAMAGHHGQAPKHFEDSGFWTATKPAGFASWLYDLKQVQEMVCTLMPWPQHFLCS